MRQHVRLDQTLTFAQTKARFVRAEGYRCSVIGVRDSNLVVRIPILGIRLVNPITNRFMEWF